MTVNLTRIYTRLGDAGETHLGDMSRVAKTHPRIEAYGTVDELNAQIGWTLTLDGLPAAYREWLARIQNDLFDVGADIAAPEDPDSDRERLRVIPEQTTWLEHRGAEGQAGGGGSPQSRPRGGSNGAPRSTRRASRCARSYSPAAPRRRRRCTSAG